MKDESLSPSMQRWSRQWSKLERAGIGSREHAMRPRNRTAARDSLSLVVGLFHATEHHQAPASTTLSHTTMKGLRCIVLAAALAVLASPAVLVSARMRKVGRGGGRGTTGTAGKDTTTAMLGSK